MANNVLSNFEKLFEGNKIILETEASYFSTLTDHPAEKGALNESHLAKLLARYLPKKYGISSGFVVSSKTFQQKTAKQLDLIIYDKLNNSPLYQSDAFGIFPIEMVYAYIEIKTTLTQKDLKSAFSANKSVRALGPDKRYTGSPSNGLAPRFYLFAYKSKISETKLMAQIEKAFIEEPEAHCHGIYVLEFDTLIARKALYEAQKVELIRWQKPAFPTFINNIHQHCHTMIPGNPNVNALALPIADMERYFKGQET